VYELSSEGEWGPSTLYHNNATLNALVSKTLLVPQVVIALRYAMVLHTYFDNEWIFIINFNGAVKTHMSYMMAAYVLGIAAPLEDTIVMIRNKFGSGCDIVYHVYAYKTDGIRGNYYHDLASSGTCAPPENSGSRSLEWGASIVYNGANGYYYYTTGYTIWEMHSLLSSDVHTKIAGDGTAGYADGFGTKAVFNKLARITADLDGNLYVADRLNSKIRKINIETFEVTSIPGRYTGIHDIVYNRRNGIDYLYVSTHGNTSMTPGSSDVIEIALNNPININKLVTSTTPITSTNTIIAAKYIYGSVSASNYPTPNLISPTNLALGSDGYPEYGTPGTYQIGLYYNPSAIYYIGSIQEIIIYTSVTTLTLPNTAILTYYIINGIGARHHMFLPMLYHTFPCPYKRHQH
jgi:hypothetical protein